MFQQYLRLRLTTYLVDNRPSNQDMKSTIFSGQPPDTHQEIPHTTSNKASRIPLQYLVNCFIVRRVARRGITRPRRRAEVSMQTDGRHLGLRRGGCVVC